MPASRFLELANSPQLFKLENQELENCYLQLHAALDPLQRSLSERQWHNLVELHFKLCLLTCRDQEAQLMLQRLNDRFGSGSRIETLQMMFLAGQSPEPLSVVPESNLVAQKLAIVKYRGTDKYEKLLAAYLDTNPIDAEAWVELSTVLEKKNAAESVQCLYQALIVEPRCAYLYLKLSQIDPDADMRKQHYNQYLKYK